MAAMGFAQCKAQIRSLQTIIKQPYRMVIEILWLIYLLSAIE
jgi:hypothetical protein